MKDREAARLRARELKELSALRAVKEMKGEHFTCVQVCCLPFDGALSGHCRT